MAAVEGVHAATATLNLTTADTVTLTGQGRKVRVTNHHATEKLWFRVDHDAGGVVTAVAEADEAYIVLAGQSVEITHATQDPSTTVSVVGNGNVYTVALVK